MQRWLRRTGKGQLACSDLRIFRKNKANGQQTLVCSRFYLASS